MGKIERRAFVCPALKRAYENAQRNAFGNTGEVPSGVSWDANKFGNSVSSKGTIVGSADCDGCGKHVTVTYNLKKIEAIDVETRKPVKLYDSIGGTESISVSGHKCSDDENQK